MAKAMVTAATTEAEMAAPDPKDRHFARQARRVALVIAGTMLFWLGAQAIGGALGLAPKYALLVDLAALAGFIWALIVTFGLWRARRA